MFRNYIKTAFRTLVRNKTFSAINILGLTISLSICLLIIKIIVNIYSSDQFHSNKDEMYRITTRIYNSPFQNSTMATSSGGLHEEFKIMTGIVDKVRIWNKFYDFGKSEKSPLPVSGYFADENFFQFFDFKLKYGDPATALQSPNSIVLAHETSSNLFDSENPLGKKITFKEYGEFVVTGVIEDVNYKSHLQFDAVASKNSMIAIDQFGLWLDDSNELDNANHVHNYVQLANGVKPIVIEQQLNNILAIQQNGSKDNLSYQLQHLSDISPGDQLMNSLGPVDEKPVMLSLVALLLILSAGFTYNNLSVAKAISRAKEVGVRKINGARKFQLFMQFIIEAIMLSLISLLLAIVLINLFAPFIMRLDTSLSESIGEVTKPIVYIYFLAFAIILGIVTGAFPAIYISKFQPAVIVKNIQKQKRKSKFNLKTSVIVFQFFLSLMLLFSIIVLYKQFNHQEKLDLGYNPDKVINVALQGIKYQNFKNALSSFSGIQDISASSLVPGVGSSAAKTIFYHNDSPDSVLLGFVQVSPNYLKNIGIEVVAGRDFKGMADGLDNGIIINKKLSNMLKYDTPMDALGNTLSFSGKDDRTIIGVAEDFVISDMTVGVEPVVIKADLHQPKYAVIRLDENANESSFITFLEKTWSKLAPFEPISHSYHTSEIDEYHSYSNSIMKFLSILTGFIILIAVMGLFGMVLYDTGSRTKEIGLRKAMGASVASVLWTLTHSYVRLILVASLIAIPLSWILNEKILQSFYNKVTLNPLWFLLGTFAIFLIGGLTVIAQSYKTANKNPVDTLRYE